MGHMQLCIVQFKPETEEGTFAWINDCGSLVVLFWRLGLVGGDEQVLLHRLPQQLGDHLDLLASSLKQIQNYWHFISIYSIFFLSKNEKKKTMKKMKKKQNLNKNIY